METRSDIRVRILTAIIVALMLVSGGLWMQTQSIDRTPATIEAELLDHNKNDGKDNCPNDGNAGSGNDNKGPGGTCRPHPPNGQYGKIK